MATSRSTSPDQPAESPAAESPAAPAVRIDFTDADARIEWLETTCEQTADLICAAFDATLPPGERMLGRKGAREMIEQATRALTSLFAVAGLDLADPPIACLRRVDKLVAKGRAATDATRATDTARSSKAS